MLTPEQEKRTWQYKAIAYTHGNQSQLGALVIAMLQRNRGAPCFLPAGRSIVVDGVSMDGGITITADGRCVVTYLAGNGDPPRREVLYSTTELQDIFRGLADVLELTDNERMAMFDELKKFIVKDLRVVSNLDMSKW